MRVIFMKFERNLTTIFFKSQFVKCIDDSYKYYTKQNLFFSPYTHKKTGL